TSRLFLYDQLECRIVRSFTATYDSVNFALQINGTDLAETATLTLDSNQDFVLNGKVVTYKEYEPETHTCVTYPVTINMGDLVDVDAKGGNDTVNLTGIGGFTGWCQVAGGAGDDLIIGSPLNDLIGGGDGNDSIYGGGGYDTLVGEGGNDTLDGGLPSNMTY